MIKFHRYPQGDEGVPDFLKRGTVVLKGVPGGLLSVSLALIRIPESFRGFRELYWFKLPIHLTAL